MPIEEQLLPSKALEPYYDKVVWLYVCRTFKDTSKDREAHRTHDRFGISSWPHHYLFDPRDGRILATMPRQLKAFVAAMDRVVKEWQPPKAETVANGRKLAKTLATARALFKNGQRRKAVAMVEPLSRQADPFEGWLEARELLRGWGRPAKDRRQPARRLSDPDPRERAIALEELAGATGKTIPRGTVERLLSRDDEDLVVRIRALRYLAKVAPESVAGVARGLLGVANDPFRYELLAVIQKHPDPSLEPALVQLFRGAGDRDHPSRNPNVLRIRTAQCLATSGGALAIDALAEPARECDTRNGLTRIVFQSLGAIGSRAGKNDRKKITGILIDSLPRPLDVSGQDPATARQTLRRHLYLVREILKAFREVSGKQQLPPAPAVWTAKERQALSRQLRRLR